MTIQNILPINSQNNKKNINDNNKNIFIIVVKSAMKIFKYI